MNTPRLLAVMALTPLLMTCAHTKTVGSNAQPVGEHHASSGKVKSSNGVPLATSPAGLLKPGAAKAIQSRLAQSGVLSSDQITGELDGETRSALARFQTQHALPATGDPDEATIKILGLHKDDVFVSGGPAHQP